MDAQEIANKINNGELLYNNFIKKKIRVRRKNGYLYIYYINERGDEIMACAVETLQDVIDWLD